MTLSLYMTRSGTSSQCSSVWRSGNGLARTSSYRWPLEPQHSTLVATCLSSLSLHTPGERYTYSNRRVTLQMHGRVWLQTPHPVNAENAEADVASRNMTRWQWRRVDRGWGRTKVLHPANGRGRKLLWYSTIRRPLGQSSPKWKKLILDSIVEQTRQVSRRYRTNKQTHNKLSIPTILQ